MRRAVRAFLVIVPFQTALVVVLLIGWPSPLAAIVVVVLWLLMGTALTIADLNGWLR